MFYNIDLILEYINYFYIQKGSESMRIRINNIVKKLSVELLMTCKVIFSHF